MSGRKSVLKTRLLFFCGLSLLHSTLIMASAPNGGALLSACRDALNSGFTGVNGQLCSWYVTPCDCRVGKEDAPRVCLPESVTAAELAGIVVAGLTEKPGLQERDAESAVASVLAPLYPCTDPSR